MDIVETLLPGVGIRYEFATKLGRTMGLVIHRTGDVDLVAYTAEDPDKAEDLILLDAHGAAALAELLGAQRMTQRFADLSREVPGLESARLPIDPGSAYAERTLGDTRARTRTGCSVVAVVRGDTVIAGPDPQTPLHPGDTLVAIGSATGLENLASILAAAPDDADH